MIRIDLTGQRFGMLTVLRQGPSRRYRHKDRPSNGCVAIMWVVRCDCGTEKAVEYGALKKGYTRSCGCVAHQTAASKITKHGHAKRGATSLEFGIWRTMLSRCYNPKVKSYADYGARGTSVCERWRTNFANFIEDMGRRPTPRHTIDRKDASGDYTPSNCRWATRAEQNLNKRGTLRDSDGELIRLKAARLGINYRTVVSRFRQGERGAQLFRKPTRRASA